MRLIDADLLTEEIESVRCTLTGLRAGKGVLARAADEYRKSILQIISDQPTSFDKEKVIEELDKLTGEEYTLHECGIRSERCKPCIAKKALDEIQQYREIGTVEECREAAEKQTQKKCAIDSCPDHTHYKCPSCGKIHLSRYKHGFPSLGRIPRFCDHCGQAIDENLEGMEDE